MSTNSKLRWVGGKECVCLPFFILSYSPVGRTQAKLVLVLLLDRLQEADAGLHLTWDSWVNGMTLHLCVPPTPASVTDREVLLPQCLPMGSLCYHRVEKGRVDFLENSAF